MSNPTVEEIVNGSGPGSQLWNLFSRLGIQHHEDCSCILLAEVMNVIGPDECEAKQDQILKLMKKNQKKYGWDTYLKAGVKMVALGWIFKIDPSNPLPGLLKIAIDKARAEEQKCQLAGHTE